MEHGDGSRTRETRRPRRLTSKDRDSAPLSRDLMESARRFAASALKAYLDRRWDLFALDAGASLEHLAKSYLASLHASLVVDGKDFDNLLHACGHPDLARSGHVLKTISAGEAVRRCRQILPHLTGHTREVELLLAVRNSVAHLGVLGERSASQSLIPFIAFSESLVRAYGGDPRRFWGSFDKFVARTKLTAKSEDEQRVAMLLERARRHFSATYGQYEEPLRQALLQAVIDSYDLPSDYPERYERTLMPCPACGTPALVTGSFEPTYEIDDDDEEPAIMEAILVNFWPESLHCKACRLELSGESETVAAGVLVRDIEFDDEDFRLRRIDAAPR